MNAEIIAIGDEITSGQNLDTNSQWLSQRLEELGVRVLYHSTVGDELTPGVEVFRQAIARADVVVATGDSDPRPMISRARRWRRRRAARCNSMPTRSRRSRDVRPMESADARVERVASDVSGRQPRGAKSARHRPGHRPGDCSRGDCPNFRLSENGTVPLDQADAVPRDLFAGRARRNGRNVARFGRLRRSKPSSAPSAV